MDCSLIFNANFKPRNFVFRYRLQNRPFEVGIDFWSDLGANMPPFSFQKPIKNALKLELGRHHFFDGFLHRFSIDFPSIWEANLGLCWLLRRAQDASKRPPRWLPSRSAGHFAILIDFSWILDNLLMDSWSNLDWFWFDVWMIFHRLLVRFLIGVLLVF